MHELEREVVRAWRAMLPREGEGAARTVVVGLSGGPDSTALLAALAEARQSLAIDPLAAHLDHGLRSAEEAAADAAAAEALAARLSVPLVTGQADAAAESRGSLEAAARAVRYRFLGAVASARRAVAVAVGHTRDDQVETVLLRLVRGTGVAGLGGMEGRRPLKEAGPAGILLRPLLEVSRAQVLRYLEARALSWRDDPTNAERRFLRNRLRHDALPALRAAAGRDVDGALLRLADQARAASATIDRLAARLLHEAADGPRRWRRAPLTAAEPAVRQRALVVLSGFAVEARHVEALERIARAGRGAVALPGGVRVVAVAEHLLLAETETETDLEPAQGSDSGAAAPVPLDVPGQAHDPRAGLTFTARRLPRSRAGAPETANPATHALLDADRAQGRLEVRRRQPGDRFWPLGASGHRTLKRFYIDRRIPRSHRARVPVVTLDGRPIWIVGYRIDERLKVTPSTAEVLELRASDAASGEKESGT